MTVQITIIGLGQIGTSIGLALGRQPGAVNRVGYDRALEVQNKARSMGALDAVKFNLSSAITTADIVLLCVPFNQIEETLKNISADLRQDAVVMDFSPVKSVAHQWFQKNIPSGRYYIGLVPSINPAFIERSGSGIEAADIDLFEKATIGIAAPSGTPADALRLASDLAGMLGASPIFLDMLEADGMAMTTHLLPQVLAASLVNATVGMPGWKEARRFASSTYAQTSAALGADVLDALEQALLSNPDVALSSLDDAIGALTYLRLAIHKGDQADLHKRLSLAFEDRESWLAERHRANWDAAAQKNELPKSGDAIKRFFIGDRSKDKKK